jgi:ligand-binding SRPBCC domain-containing protein
LATGRTDPSDRKDGGKRETLIMKLYRIHRRQVLPCSVAVAWRFFSSPRNLPAITPPWLNVAIVGDVPNEMAPGMLIQYRLTPLAGLPVAWLSEITQVDEPRYFVDEQRIGPYRFWHHQHHFRPVANGVEMIDRVTYGMKFGLVGILAHSVVVDGRLCAIFDYRYRAIERYFEAGRVSQPPSPDSTL